MSLRAKPLSKPKPGPKKVDLLGLPPIMVDPRTGSKDLLPLLRKRGLPAQAHPMEVADVAWVAKGPEGEVKIGLERKRLGDLLQCIGDGRFAGRQLPRLKAAFDVAMLVIEGAYRADPKTGLLQVPGGGGKWKPYAYGGITLASAVAKWRTTMRFKAGLIVERTWNDEETADLIANEYGWWCLGKGWDGHKAHLAVNTALVDQGIFNSLKRRGQVAACLPGVGAVMARKAQHHFRTIRKMVAAPVSEWRKVGMDAQAAVGVVRAMDEEEEA